MMDALVVEAPSRFDLRRVPIPEPGRHEVLCRVRAVAICGTDTHIIAGEFPGFWPKEFPFTPGHEWSGEVVSVGQGSADLGWATGNRVAGTSHAACGVCRNCVEGRYNVCENYGRDGLHTQYGHNAPGAYAGYVVHSIKSVFRIPDHLGFDEAALLDPAAIALHTNVRGGVRPGDTVAITGAGVMGLLVAECARAIGAGRVIVVGRGPRLRKARELGYETVDATAVDPAEAIRGLTDGLGADVALECAGVPDTLQWCVRMLRRGGRCAVVGIPMSDVALPIQSMVLDEIDLVGVRASAGEMARVIPLVEAKRIRVADLITHRYSLREFPAAFKTFVERQDGVLKVIVHP